MFSRGRGFLIGWAGSEISQDFLQREQKPPDVLRRIMTERGQWELSSPYNLQCTLLCGSCLSFIKKVDSKRQEHYSTLEWPCPCTHTSRIEEKLHSREREEKAHTSQGRKLWALIIHLLLSCVVRRRGEMVAGLSFCWQQKQQLKKREGSRFVLSDVCRTAVNQNISVP